MKYVALLTAVGLGSAAFLAVAGPDEHGPMGRLKKADTNGDGMISREEASALPMIAKHFDEIDTNHDGLLTVEELRAWHAKQRDAHWKKIDTDGDGRISRAEAQANAPRLFEHFDQLDLNKDGYLTPDELAMAHPRRGPPPR